LVSSRTKDATALNQAGSTIQVTALGVFSNNTLRDITTTCSQWHSNDCLVH
jgi:hypothetical protein